MSLRLVALSVDSQRPESAAAFWAGLLERDVVEETGGVLVPGDATQVGLRFVGASTESSGRNRLHLHVTSSTIDEQRQIVETVLRLGGRRRGTRPLPLGRIIYMRDPDGDEFCVIEPGNRYLAGCGRLGELTCDGTRTAGAFWRDALQWSVVWDQDEQIAIQSPDGGTKIAWDDWRDSTVQAGERYRFDLETTDLAAEVERLVALGATRLAQRAGAVALSDPDGREFSVSSAN